MKTTKSLYTVLVAVAFVASGCGGGGGGESASAPATPAVTSLCPNDSAVPATGTKDCPAVGPTITTPVDILEVTPRLLKQGLTVQFNGTLDPGSVTNVVLWKGTVGTGTKVAGAASLAAGNKDLTFAAVQFLANGSSYTLDINATDSLGRPVHLTIPFTTTAMVCADNATWSNPANFSPVYQDCVADLGVQTLVNPVFNTVQDTTCNMNVGSALTPECKAYMANGTMMLSNTSTVANGHSTIWMAYIGTDGISYIVLLDTGTASAPVIIGKLALPSSLVWIIGNPTGANIDITTSVNGVLRNGQVTWNASTSSLVVIWRN